jgi:hypothetical protein
MGFMPLPKRNLVGVFYLSRLVDENRLLIEVSSKLVNTQNYSHQDSILGGLSCFAGFVRIDEFRYV